MFGVLATGSPYGPVRNGTSWSAMTIRTFTSPPGTDHLPVGVAAVLDGALLRLVVDVDEPEALCVAELPLEVVHQRPVAVAEHRHALRDRVVDGGEVVAEERDAARVVPRLGEDAAVLGD